MSRMSALIVVGIVLLGGCKDAALDPISIQPQFSSGWPDIYVYSTNSAYVDEVRAAVAAWDNALNAHANLRHMYYGSAAGAIQVNFVNATVSNPAGWCGEAANGITIYRVAVGSSCPASLDALITNDLKELIMHELAHHVGGRFVHSGGQVAEICIGRVRSSSMNFEFCPHEIQEFMYQFGARGVVPPTDLYDMANGLTVVTAGATLNINDTRTYRATWQFTGGSHNPSLASLPSMSWSTSNTSVAQLIHQAGDSAVIKVVGAGTADVNATVTGFHTLSYYPFQAGTSWIAGNAPIPSIATITISPSWVSVPNDGQGSLLTATALDSQGQIINGVTFNWSSDHPSIASVTGASANTAWVVGNTRGTATIRATAGGVAGTATAQTNCPPNGACF